VTRLQVIKGIKRIGTIFGKNGRWAFLLVTVFFWWFRPIAATSPDVLHQIVLEEQTRKEKLMDELIKMVSKKSGISEAQAKKAVETVLGFLKKKLPAPIAGQIESVLAGGDLPDLGDLGKLLG
jgi:hypothetical protein